MPTNNKKRQRSGGGGCSSDGDPPLRRRVVLLLDLDCFYAQACCVRLGYDAAETPLALFQWNSVLAVTYPARTRYGVRRGDSWEAVHSKSRGHCLGVHVPILTTTATTTDTNSDSNNNGGTSDALDQPPASLRDEYDHLFRLTGAEQERARRAELGARKYSADGKACIECFRIASARIFEVVREAIANLPCTDGSNGNGNGGVVLERASIDEFFLDVTGAVNELERTADRLDLDEAMRDTVSVGDRLSGKDSSGGIAPAGPVDEDNAESLRLLRAGSFIARRIRRAVSDQLGFTLSAGVGHNKMLAKLAASHGKPNGQALCAAGAAVRALLDATAIGNCRNLGGKLGAAVQRLLPDSVPSTVGSIARHLSLPALQRGLGGDAGTAQWVHNVAHGIDDEAVEAKTSTSVLTKSITAFKSLNFAPPGGGTSAGGTANTTTTGHTLEEAERWIRLVSQEVVARVERDAARNERYPRTCNIQYGSSSLQANRNKSVRIPFPTSRLSAEQKVAHLVDGVAQAIRSKEMPTKIAAPFRLHRVGICAVDFESTSSGTSHAIDSYFKVASPKGSSTVPNSQKKPAASLHAPVCSPVAEPEAKSIQSTPNRQNVTHAARVDVDSDLDLAKRLQATYDRENAVQQMFDARKKRPSKKSKGIDSFFQKK
jgi:DNA polymerase eta